MLSVDCPNQTNVIRKTVNTFGGSQFKNLLVIGILLVLAGCGTSSADNNDTSTDLSGDSGTTAIHHLLRIVMMIHLMGLRVMTQMEQQTVLQVIS